MTCGSESVLSVSLVSARPLTIVYCNLLPCRKDLVGTSSRSVVSLTTTEVQVVAVNVNAARLAVTETDGVVVGAMVIGIEVLVGAVIGVVIEESIEAAGAGTMTGTGRTGPGMIGAGVAGTNCCL